MQYDVETLILYQDMNSRELFQQRRILPNGDTVWEDSPLVRAAKEGKLCVLDGMERVHSSMIEALAPLIHHRFLQLPDGSRLVSEMQYDLIQARNSFSGEQLLERKVHKIASNFRLIGVGDSESANSSNKWLNEQMLSMFLYHTLKPMSVEDEMHIFVNGLQNSSDPAIKGIAYSLSLRRIIFILKRHSLNPEEGIYEAINRAALVKFLHQS
uniref:ATPase dynein-related AAA domain-containing protein n=1 Tax=Ditylenchus dipsaci TaxID=166011 RepID=A0A915CQ05_9BILA